jgi:hypothetical protein
MRGCARSPRPKTRGHFPRDDAASKLIWLALRNITVDWGRAAKDWKEAMNQFAILYEDRFTQPPHGAHKAGQGPEEIREISREQFNQPPRTQQSRHPLNAWLNLYAPAVLDLYSRRRLVDAGEHDLAARCSRADSSPHLPQAAWSNADQRPRGKIPSVIHFHAWQMAMAGHARPTHQWTVASASRRAAGP